MNGAILMLWKSRLRGALRRSIALVLLISLGGGVCLAVAAGARRTSAAYDTMVALSNAGELGSSYGPGDADAVRNVLLAIPSIANIGQITGFQVSLPESPLPGVNSFAFDEHSVVGVPIVLEGRLPERRDEVFLNEAGAAGAKVRIGDRLNVTVANQDFTEFASERLIVVGIGLLIDEIYEDETAIKAFLVYSQDFAAEHQALSAWGAVSVTLIDGANRTDVAAELLASGLYLDDDRDTDRSQARAAVQPLVSMLWVLALLAGAATVIIIGQGIARLLRRSEAEKMGVAAIGCSRPMLLAVDAAVAVTVSVFGLVGAVALAALVSPLFPQGRARRITALRGFDLDVGTLGLGALALLVALVAVVATATQRRIRTAATRPGSAPGILGVVASVSTGVQFATGRRGLLGAVGGAAIGLASIVAAVVFAGSMQHLVSRPELSGFNWDVMGRDSYAQIDTTAVAKQVQGDPGVERVTGLTFVDVNIDGQSTPGSLWAAIDGSPWPPVTSGRSPQGPNEVLVGTRTLERIGKEIGDSVDITFSSSSFDAPLLDKVEMVIVGTAVSPSIGIPGSDTPRLDEGVLFRREDLADGSAEYGSAVLFDLAEGTDPESIKSEFPSGLPDDVDAITEWFESSAPAEVIQADEAIDVLVLAIAALLIAVVGAVANNMLGFIRERRNAFAVLRALGFTSRQIRTTVLTQTGVVVGAAVVVALPIGLVAGRFLYRAFADGIGVIVEPVAPVLALLASVVGAVALVQIVALVPARQARRTDASIELRHE